MGGVGDTDRRAGARTGGGPMGHALVIAHRGASHDAPENTVAAFHLAVAQRADMIETDLHLTRDGRVVLFHDDVLGGTPVSRLTLEEIRVRAPSVPTLEEGLDAVSGALPFNLEFKSRPDEDYRGVAHAAACIVGARDMLGRVLWSSKVGAALEAIRAEADGPLGIVVPRVDMLPGALARARDLDAEGIHPNRRVVGTPDVLRRLQDEGYAVRVYTVDAPADLERLMDWGVDGVFTNRPALMRRLVDARAG